VFKSFSDNRREEIKRCAMVKITILAEHMNRLRRMMDTCVCVQELVSNIDKTETLILISIKHNMKEEENCLTVYKVR